MTNPKIPVLATLVGFTSIVLGCSPGDSNPPIHRISGTISGEYVVGVTVKLTGAARATTSTDVKGQYSFGSLASGSYAIFPSYGSHTFSPAAASVTIAGADVVQDFTSSAWSVEGTAELLHGLWGSSQTDLWGVGEFGTILHRVGSVWQSVTNPLSGTRVTVNGIWGSSPNDVWAVGNSAILHWDGSAWTSANMPLGFDLLAGNGVWGSSPNDVWAVGNVMDIKSLVVVSGAIHWDGTTWSAGPTAGMDVNAIWGSGPSDVWAVGGSWKWGGAGEIQHWNGTAWSSVANPVAGNVRALGMLNGIWGSGPSDVWAVGWWQNGPPGADGAIILHWDGAVWSSVAHPQSGGLGPIWGSGPNDVWAVAGSGTLRWDGTAWASMPGVTVRGVYGDQPVVMKAIWGSGPADIWATGDYMPNPLVFGTSNVILHRVP